MSRTQGHVDTVIYAQFEAEFEPPWTARAGDDLGIRRVKMVRYTLARPEQPKPGVIVVKLTVRLPASAFYPLQPEAVVVVPESLIEQVPVEVVAEDPHAPGEDETS